MHNLGLWEKTGRAAESRRNKQALTRFQREQTSTKTENSNHVWRSHALDLVSIVILCSSNHKPRWPWPSLFISVTVLCEQRSARTGKPVRSFGKHLNIPSFSLSVIHSVHSPIFFPSNPFLFSNNGIRFSKLPLLQLQQSALLFTRWG